MQVEELRNIFKEEYMLMLENTEVLYFNFTDDTIQIFRDDLVPFGIRGNVKSSDDITASSRNMERFRDWLANRTLSLSRDNIKQICALFNIPQRQNTDNKVNICMACKGVSLQDCYWIKSYDSLDGWEDVDIKRKHLHEIIDVALKGYSPTITSDINSPDLTTKGLFRKAWIRNNGELYLLKSDRTDNNINTRMEVLISEILDCTNIPHVQYELLEYDDITVSRCKCFRPDGFSYIDAYEVQDYCRVMNLDYEEEMLKTFGSEFANIPVIDIAIANTDRHTENYAFMMDNRTGCLVSVGKLYDHNQSGIAYLLGSNYKDTLSQMIDYKVYTLRELADKYRAYTDIQVDFNKLNNLKERYPQYISVINGFENTIREYL